MEERLKSYAFILAVMSLLTFTGCGGGGPTGSSPSTTPYTIGYTIGGTVSGLFGTGLVLQDDGGNNLTVSANGAFVFTIAIASGSTYAVTVLTQPSNPAQSCAVTNGSGTSTADVANVQVACPVPPPVEVSNIWVMPASVAIAQQSSETVLIGVNGGAVPADHSSTSSLRRSRRAFVGARGNVEADDGSGVTLPATVQVSGLPDGVTVSPPSVVITSGGPPPLMTFSVSASAVPGSATATLTGTSTDLTSTPAVTLAVPFTIMPTPPPTTMCPTSTPPPSPNPSPAPKEWTWESGAITYNQQGVYGTQGTPAAGNVPGARVYASTWTDTAGNFWLFGGYGYASASAGLGNGGGSLNNLWKYSQGEWTWVGGSDGFNQAGVYGTLGVTAPSNLPGGRDDAVSWTDPSGNFWLFGGWGIDSTGTGGDLSDLWKYSGGEWTWMSGPDTVNYPNFHPSVYGTMGTPAPGNTPGARTDAASWADACGNLWLFGGYGWDSNGTSGILNDLWKYSGGEWTWMSGANIVDQNGTYGTLGAAAPGNIPGSRTDAVTWTDPSGNLWLFGGQGGDLNGLQCEEEETEMSTCVLNDLWEYSGGEWTWMGGSNVAQQPGTYGTQGVAAADNVPGGRWQAVSWTDAQGNFWLFGGVGYSTAGTDTSFGDLNDLWKYSGGQWTWMSGSNYADQLGTYGTQGSAAPGNVLGCRDSAVGWIDASGNLWVFSGRDEFSILFGGVFNDLWKYQP